jgi:hypothetical protein
MPYHVRAQSGDVACFNVLHVLHVLHVCSLRSGVLIVVWHCRLLISWCAVADACSPSSHEHVSLHMHTLPSTVPVSSLAELQFTIRRHSSSSLSPSSAAANSAPLSIADLTFAAKNPLLVDLPRDEVMEAQAAVRIQAQARRKQAAERVAALKAELAREELSAKQQAAADTVEHHARQLASHALAAAIARSASVDETLAPAAEAEDEQLDVETAMQTVRYRSVLAAARPGTLCMAVRDFSGIACYASLQIQLVKGSGAGVCVCVFVYVCVCVCMCVCVCVCR